MIEPSGLVQAASMTATAHNRRRPGFRTGLVVLVVVASGAVAAVADVKVQPQTGLYGGWVNNNGEGAGFFKVVAGGKRIVPYPGWPIKVPTDFICKAGDITASNSLKASKIPIKNGAFSYSGTPLGPGQTGRTITVKGSWKGGAKIVGSSKTTGGGCNHKVNWTMTAPPPNGYGGP